MSQVECIRNNQLVLPVVPPQDYNDTQMLTAESEDLEDIYPSLDDSLAVTGSGDDVWWVISPKLVAWLAKKL